MSVFGCTPVSAPALLILAAKFLPALLLAKLTEGGTSSDWLQGEGEVTITFHLSFLTSNEGKHGKNPVTSPAPSLQLLTLVCTLGWDRDKF